VVGKFQCSPWRVNAQFFRIHHSDVRHGGSIACRTDGRIVCHHIDASVPRRRENYASAGKVSLNAILRSVGMPKCEDRLRFKVQPEGRAGGAQGAFRLCRELIAIINCTSGGSRGSTHVCPFGVRDPCLAARPWQAMVRRPTMTPLLLTRIGDEESYWPQGDRIAPNADFSEIRYRL